jgi:two-component system sensor histidine kinase KdpD
MAELFINKVSKSKQFIFSLLLVLVVSVLCFLGSSFISHRVVALILLVTVSVIAISFDIYPVLAAAAFSALIWNFFFIPPRFTFHVHSTDDTILFIMYFIIAMINAVLTYKIRTVEKVAREKEEKANTVKLYNTLLNSLSHELKTPIATIIGATDNLQSNSTNLTPHHKEELIGEIAKASFRLNQQVENLLNMSRLEAGFIQPRKDWCDVQEIVFDCLKRVVEN